MSGLFTKISVEYKVLKPVVNRLTGSQVLTGHRLVVYGLLGNRVGSERIWVISLGVASGTELHRSIHFLP